MSRPDSTIVVERADALGLAQLYQIRGRVGRSDQIAHAYLFYPDASELALDCLLDELLVVLADVGLHRSATLGRGLDNRHVAQAGERHLERARNRRGAQG